MNQRYWEQFAKTGKIADYLSYCENRAGKSKTETYGEKNSESANNHDGNDPVGITDRRI